MQLYGGADQILFLPQEIIGAIVMRFYDSDIQLPVVLRRAGSDDSGVNAITFQPNSARYTRALQSLGDGWYCVAAGPEDQLTHDALFGDRWLEQHSLDSTRVNWSFRLDCQFTDPDKARQEQQAQVVVELYYRCARVILVTDGLFGFLWMS